MLRMPRLFQDGMVLQRDVRIPVWGWAAPAAAVTVTLADRTERGVADASGAWSVAFPALSAGGPHTLTVESEGATVTVRDIVVGDVWVASGQSNMEWPLSAAKGGAEAIAASADPMLREFAVPLTWSYTPQPDLEGGSWQSADPEHSADFSAVAYFFARDLRAELDVPIGIIHTSWGGSSIEAWMSREALGMSESDWAEWMRQEQERSAELRDALEARIGGLPETDAGLVDGRAVWSDPELDDADWDAVPVPSLWEEAGFAGLDGTAWYRFTFALTEAEAQQDALVSLGMIDDDDVAFVNGTEVGRTEGYNLRREYDVPASALRSGANVLTVHVADGGGGGGLYGDAADFYLETSAGRTSLADTWKFKVGSVRVQEDGQRINKIPSALYNQMLHPLLRYPIKGAIWYQGESNANSDEQAAAYRPLFQSLIQSWRQGWAGADDDFPFLWVQLPNFGPVDAEPPDRAAWATLRESQTAALALPNTGQAVAIDVGNPDDIHPLDKEPVGARLARIAREVAYGESLATSGPVYRSHTVQNGEVVIEWDHATGGLVSTAEGGIEGFALAGPDRRWVWADARIDGDRVVVSSPEVSEPVAVRYAWSNSPPNLSLFNHESLPAAPFRTDDW